MTLEAQSFTCPHDNTYWIGEKFSIALDAEDGEQDRRGNGGQL